MKKVSVVVPAYNNSQGLATLLNALLKQTYPKTHFEIIVVDNGSEDGTLDVAKKIQNDNKELVRILIENSIKSSYAARNKGLMNSQWEIIALIDSDCVPIPEWIERGVSSLEDLGADLIGGQVKYKFPSTTSAADIYDSLTNIQVESTIKNHGSAPTANIFVLRKVFDKVGLFPQTLKSGGDIIWTGMATNSGFKLKYAPEVIVAHPTRGLRELIKKKFRVAGGHWQIWQSKGIGRGKIVKKIIQYFFPPRPRHIARLIEDHGTPAMKNQFWSIWLVAWLCRYATNIGRLHSLLSISPISLPKP
jgi:glycosyltransferase involved in cell wall biosynthesis